jgi:hypothetical protein
MRTRKEILEIINGGETININGVDYNRNNAHAVPSDADLAMGDPEKEDQVEQSIQRQMEKLQAELKKLEAVKAARKAPNKEDEPKGGVITGDKASEPKKEEAKAEAKSEPKSEPKAEAKSEAKK